MINSLSVPINKANIVQLHLHTCYSDF